MERALTPRAPSPQPCWCCLLLVLHRTDGAAAPARARRSLKPRESRVLRTTHYTCFSCVSRIFIYLFNFFFVVANLVTAAATQKSWCYLPLLLLLLFPWRMPMCGGFFWARCVPELAVYAPRDAAAAAAVSHDNSISTTDRNLVAQSVLAFRNSLHRSQTPLLKRPLTENRISPYSSICRYRTGCVCALWTALPWVVCHFSNLIPVFVVITRHHCHFLWLHATGIML